jgi:hypothetical protein
MTSAMTSIVLPPIIAHTQDIQVIDVIEAFFETRCIKTMRNDGYKMYIEFDKIHNPNHATVSKVRDFVTALSTNVVLCYDKEKYILTTQYLDL